MSTVQQNANNNFSLNETLQYLKNEGYKVSVAKKGMEWLL
jgi:hypothetical protein